MIITRMSNRASVFYRSITVISAVVFVLTTCGPAFAKTVGRSGNIYRIAEPDALKELEDKAASTDLKERIKKEETTRRIERYRPSTAVSLPSAKKDRTSLVDMSYKLDFDIPDGKGGVLYPKGFIFNPLDYIPFSRTIVVLNGAAENEVDWFTASKYYKRADVILLITDGTWKDLMGRFKRNVFYLTEPVATRFRVSATPSIIVKKDNKYMEVREIHVPEKKDSKNRRN
jgi:conjugal transfer pilus assembly protein TraW